jgi:hypothetical protein
VLSIAASLRKLLSALSRPGSWIGFFSAAVPLRPLDASRFEISDADWLRQAQAIERTFTTHRFPGATQSVVYKSPSGLVPPASGDEESTHDLLVAIIAMVSEMLGAQQAAADAEEGRAKGASGGGASTSRAGGAGGGPQARVLAALAWSMLPAAAQAVELLHARWANGEWGLMGREGGRTCACTCGSCC